jgi:tetratricopeptide (TPR) repeat protein
MNPQNKEIVKYVEKGDKAFCDNALEDAINFYNLALEEIGKLVHDLVLKQSRVSVSDINKSHEVTSEEFYTFVINSAIKAFGHEGKKHLKMPTAETAQKILNDEKLRHQTFENKDDSVEIYPAYIAHFYRFLISNDTFARIIYSCGIVRVEMSEYEKAEKAFKTSIEFTPINSNFTDPQHHLNLLKKIKDSEATLD